MDNTNNSGNVRAWCLTRSNGKIFGLGPVAIPQVYRTREEARDASKRLLDTKGIKTFVRSSDEVQKAWAVARDGKIIGNGVTSKPMVFKTREAARSAVLDAQSFGYTEVSVVRLGV